MKLFNLGELPWKKSQLIYHALAYQHIEGLVLHSTKESYMCVGLHQDPKVEIDVDFCAENDIGIFRREIGGGIVLLEKKQIFYHLILHRNNPIVPRIPNNFFKKFLQPVIAAYHDLGIGAEYRPLCDLVVNNKKISGNGGGEVGECKVLGGGILLDFDYDKMAKAVKSPPSMKKRYLELMKDNMTTVRQELGFIPSYNEICSQLTTRFKELLGPLEQSKVDDDIKNKMIELDDHYSTEKWLYQRGVKQIGREIKIREGVFLFHENFEISHKKVGITFETEENKIRKVTFSPSSSISVTYQKNIKEKVIGLEYDKNILENLITDLLNKQGGILVA